MHRPFLTLHFDPSFLGGYIKFTFGPNSDMVPEKINSRTELLKIFQPYKSGETEKSSDGGYSHYR